MTVQTAGIPRKQPLRTRWIEGHIWVALSRSHLAVTSVAYAHRMRRYPAKDVGPRIHTDVRTPAPPLATDLCAPIMAVGSVDHPGRSGGIGRNAQYPVCSSRDVRSNEWFLRQSEASGRRFAELSPRIRRVATSVGVWDPHGDFDRQAAFLTAQKSASRGPFSCGR